MSTCQGAPAPHLNCPHGDRCDWDGWDALYDEYQAKERAGEVEVIDVVNEEPK